MSNVDGSSIPTADFVGNIKPPQQTAQISTDLTNEDTADKKNSLVDDLSNVETTCQLTFHGAAANSCPHSLLCVRAPSSTSSPTQIETTERSDADAPSNNNNNEGNNQEVDTIIYASSGVINLATSYNSLFNNNIASVDETLVTRTLDHASAPSQDGDDGDDDNKKVLARGEAVEDAAAARSITALSWVTNNTTNGKEEGEDGGRDIAVVYGIVAAYSDGSVTTWRYNPTQTANNNQESGLWKEHVIVGHDPEQSSTDPSKIFIHNYQEGLNKSKLHESIPSISSINLDTNTGSTWLIVTASSQGIYLHVTYVVDTAEENIEMVYTHSLGTHAASSVTILQSSINECYVFAGSASPRHNKVWVYTIPYSDQSDPDAWLNLPLLSIGEPNYHGYLLGHQDWITCFAWLKDFVADGGGGESSSGNKKSTSLLASSGHDAKIRLWKFSSWNTNNDDNLLPGLENKEDDDNSGASDDSDDDDEANIDDLEEEEGEARLIVNHAAFSSETNNNTTVTTAVSLEALLLGHEEAVTSLTWRRSRKTSDDKPCLLSSSMDRTILLWMEESDATGSVWVPISRVGSAGGILGGSIGASLMGFVDAKFSPDAKRIVGHGYGGSIHFWTQVLQSETKTVEAKEENDTLVERPEGEDQDAQPDPAEEIEEVEEEDALVSARWVADPCITGHFRSVEDMAWDPNGEYMLTTSSDQTTRLWTEVPVSTDDGQCRWVEVGRPQVHGYDMTSIVCVGGQDNSGIGDGEPCHRFVSGADEKVLRVFDAPSSTLSVLQSIKHARDANKGDDDTPPSPENPQENQSSWRVERAFMPSLGLSNKATADTDQESSKFAGPTNDDDDLAQANLDTEDGRCHTSFKYPNVERDLAVTTLWPEARKLFGHESELVCLDAYRAPLGTNEPSLVASSCKARNDVESAAIRLWDVKKGKCVGILKGGHRSTVSTMSFSRDGKYLASSGKDRRICIWKKIVNADPSSDDGLGYELSAAADSAHKRIVWSVHFCPKRPDILASGSRDGLVKVWQILEVADGSFDIKEVCTFEPSCKDGKIPITAVAFAENMIEGSDDGQADYAILSIGTESGRIEIWAVPTSKNDEKTSPTLLYVIPSNGCHFDTVKKVAWRPSISGAEDKEGGMIDLTLASCGQDNGVRIFKVGIRRSAVEATAKEDIVEAAKETQVGATNEDNSIPSGPKKKFIALVSNGCPDRKQSGNQERALGWFNVKKVPHNVVDGMDLEQREMRNKLFEISGIRGNYPQFFFELEDGSIEFYGNFAKIEDLNETNGLPIDLLAQHPDMETWDRVFSTVVDSFE